MAATDVNTVHFKVNSCCLKARNVQVQVRDLNHRVQVQVRQKPDSSPSPGLESYNSAAMRNDTPCGRKNDVSPAAWQQWFFCLTQYKLVLSLATLERYSAEVDLGGGYKST